MVAIFKPKQKNTPAQAVCLAEVLVCYIDFDFLLRKHLTHIFTVLLVPPSEMRTFLIFGFHILLARLETWLRVMLILLPVCMPLSHTEHLAIPAPP